MKPVERNPSSELNSAQVAQISQFATLLRQWNPKINLVAPSTLPDLERRHIVDCAQLVPFLPQQRVPDGLEVLDVGSGAGLPGIILAIHASQHRFTLAERDQRKCAFLHTAIYKLGLKNVKVHAADVKDIHNQYDVITSRAWADMQSILEMTSPLLKISGEWLLLKGKALDEELRACETLFHLTIERTPSIVPSTDGEHGWILKLKRT